MLGLIKKDLLVIKSQFKIMFILLFILLFIAFQEDVVDITLLLPMVGFMMFLPIFSYDEFNKWNSYVSTMPNGRKNAVRARYCATVLVILFLVFISLILSVGINFFRDETINITELMMELMGNFLGVSLVVALLYPVMYKWGALNGRIIMFIFVTGIILISGILPKYVDMSSLITTINSIEKIGYIALPFISILLYLGSYLISLKIYMRKDF